MPRGTRAARAKLSHAGLVVAGAALLAACSTILGIEDLSGESRDDGGSSGESNAGTSGGLTAGKGGSAGNGSAQGGTAGRMNSGGSSGAPAAGKGGAAGASGSNSNSGGTDAGNGANGGGGSSGSSGGTDAGSAGTAGTAGTGPGPGTVHGSVIDFWHHPLPGVSVAIGETTAVTDAGGVFEIADVPGQYDASLIIEIPSPTAAYGWVYQGLTRRDPTLQVYLGLESQETAFFVTQTGGTFGPNSQWLVAFGSDSGADVANAPEDGLNRRPSWRGGNSNDWTVHSLFLEQVASLPTAYTAYETKTATVTSAAPTEDVEMDLTPQTLNSGMVSGTVTGNPGSSPTTSAFVRFTSGAALPVLEDVNASAGAFSYLVPDLLDGSVTVAAIESNTDSSYALAHRDSVGLGAMAVDLQIPVPAQPLSPASATQNVSGSTAFSFAGATPETNGYLVWIEAQTVRHGLFIVTASKEFTLSELPVVGGQFTLVPNEWHNWEVQTHGAPGGVDAMAGPNGFIDSFGPDWTRPQGPVRGDGSFTRSAVFEFLTAE